MISLRTLLLLALTTFISCDESNEEVQGTFTVVGSNLIRFKQSYRASVVHQNFVKEQTLQISVRSKDEKGNGDFDVSKNVTLLGSGIQILDFDVREIYNYI
jgi:hypothetical protein